MYDDFDDEKQEMIPLENDKYQPSSSPNDKRFVRDYPYLVLFGAGLYGLITLSTYGFTYGDPQIYMKGYDSWGNVCGKEKNRILPGVSLSGKNQSNNTFVFHMGLSNLNTALDPFKYIRSSNKPAVICVKECPKNITDCRDLLKDSGYLLPESFIKQHVCIMPFGLILSHFDFLKRCIPKQLLQVSFKSNSVIIDNHEKMEALQRISFLPPRVPLSALSTGTFFLVSLQRFWLDGAYLAPVPVILCFITAFCFRLLSRIVVLIISVVFGMGSVVLTLYMWYSYLYIDQELAGQSGVVVKKKVLPGPEIIEIVKKKINMTFNSPRIEADYNAEKQILEAMDLGYKLSDVKIYVFNTSSLYKILAIEGIEDSKSLLGWTIFFTIGTFVLLLLLIWLRKSFKFVINLFDEASKALLGIPVIFIQPFVTLIFLLLVCSHFFASSVYLITILTPAVDGRGFVKYVNSNKTSVNGMLVGNLLGSLWLWEFASGCEQFIIAGAVSHWFYFRQNYRLFECCPTLEPIRNLLKYSLGTIAVGSLIVTVVDYTKILFHYVNSILRKKRNAISKKTTGAVICCLNCTEKVLKFANRNAYICAAVYGTSFWQSGKQGISLLIRNAEHTTVINVISFFFLFLAKSCVVVLTGAIAFFYFKQKYGPEVTVVEYGFVIFLLCLFAFIVARCFFRVYDVVLNTLFVCFCDDHERNNGLDRPYHSTRNWNNVMKTIMKKNRKDFNVISVIPRSTYNDNSSKFDKSYQPVDEG